MGKEDTRLSDFSNERETIFNFGRGTEMDKNLVKSEVSNESSGSIAARHFS